MFQSSLKLRTEKGGKKNYPRTLKFNMLECMYSDIKNIRQDI